MNKKLLLTLLATSTFMLSSCARYRYVESPVVSQLKHQNKIDVDLSISSDTKGLLLVVRNKTKNDLEINWDKTLFVRNGSTKGTFMFNGIVYSKRNEHKPNSIVFAGGTLEKVIYPNINVYRWSKGWDISVLNINANKKEKIGVSLFIESESGEYRETALIEVSKEPVK